MEAKIIAVMVMGFPFLATLILISWFIWRESSRTKKFKQDSLRRIQQYDDLITAELTRKAREAGHTVDGYDVVRDKSGHPTFVPFVITQGVKIPVELHKPGIRHDARAAAG